VLEIGRMIAAALEIEFEFEFAPPRPGEVQRTASDPGRAAAELGWRAAHDLERGIPITAEWFRSA
jgi:UDP-glucose 4-epimerase